MHTQHRRSLLVAIALLATVAAVAPTAGAGATPAAPAGSGRSALRATPLRATGRRSVAKSRTSRSARSDADLLARTDGALVPVVVKYDYDSIATYQGEPGGPAPTSPAVTNQPLTQADATTSAYARVVVQREAEITAAVRQAVPAAQIGTSLRVVYGGVAMVVPANRAKDLLAVDGVVAVQEDVRNELLTDSSPEFLDVPPVWQSLGGQATAGAGVVFADLDSGVWPEHPSFAADPALPDRPTAPGGGELACDFGDNPLTAEDDPFTCNDKLVGGHAFLATYNEVAGGEQFPDTARDSDGHGTHTTTTAAGDIVEHATVLGVDRGAISGLAPGAAVIEYKVCGAQGCYSSDSAEAVGQAILDGADVINYSISGGTDPFGDPVELAFLDAYEAGVFTAASAGNDGPDASTANHLGPWVTSVAASTQTRAFESTLSLTGDDGATLELTGASITAGVAEATPIVLAGDLVAGDDRCEVDPTTDDAVPDDVYAGVIVACERGGNARIEKGYNVAQGGAVGQVLYNPTLADTETDNHWLPTVHLADGAELVDFLGAHAPVAATFTPGAKTEAQGDVMAAFSSRGPAGSVIKPDVAAPGVQILAGQTPVLDGVDLGPEGEQFMAIAGTSMAGPHVAGAAILLKAAHPDWGPGEIHSALMTTATTEVVKEDEVTPADPFDMGAGRIDVDDAADPGLVLSATADDFRALAGDAGQVGTIDLNLPSIDAPQMPGREVTTRTFTNVGAGSATYRVSATAPPGTSISVAPSSFTVASGASKEVTITITASVADGQQRFGQIDLTAPGRQPLHLPVAFVPTQATLSATSSCDDTTLDFGASAACEVTVRNDSFAATTVSIDASTTPQLTITDAGDADHTEHEASIADVELAGRQPGVPSLDPQDGYGGFVELAGLVDPDPIGDEEFVSYTDFGEFVFNGKVYDEVNVNSNGYLVAGSATSEDDVCCPPQLTPDSAPPNDVIAPFWSDLAGDTGTPAGEEPLGVYAALFGDDATGDEWLVIETRLTDCCDGDAEHGTTKVSQVWLGLNGTQDITIDYPADAIPDTTGIEQEPGDPLAVVGVQNEFGQGDSIDATDAVLPSDLFVLSTDPVPGDSYTLPLVLEGTSPGAGALTGEITSPSVHGTTVVDTAISVGPKPLEGAAAFVDRAYRDFLGRAPSADEQTFVQAALANGSLTRRAFVRTLATSDEYLGHEVDERYAQILDRAPDPSGRAYWIRKLRSGLSERGLVASITGSNELYTKAGGTPDGFAARAYAVLLGRTATASERAAVVSQLAGGASRSGVAGGLYQSLESRRLRVANLYQHFLHRDPDPSGQAYWANVIATKGDIVLALELASSNEYVHRTR